VDGKLEAVFVEDGSKPACFYAYPVGYSNSSEDGLPFVDVSRRKLVAHSTSGAPDGIHVDDQGNV
jgi:sugar lactone lactonase YvrE